jgi:hypothetical protein
MYGREKKARAKHSFGLPRHVSFFWIPSTHVDWSGPHRVELNTFVYIAIKANAVSAYP